jgi:hypothetical protein
VLGTLFADPSSHDTGMQPFLCLFLSYLYALFADPSSHDKGTEFSCSWSAKREQ